MRTIEKGNQGWKENKEEGQEAEKFERKKRGGGAAEAGGVKRMSY